ncbi:hypothetical protein KIN20_028259 [Parelaphostrongylus tenuis]|uniref:Uncharacterized protein n=1 Tax=Parelaphostrongylus tenuis TaxID=148309 RepID=A0AAD5R0S7_PARTN|nr:hypothetical protein KIN20_028259 [Parelaphostrongylus tenuis]
MSNLRFLGLLVNAKVEQQRLAQQLAQPPSANEAEEVVSSIIASVDTPHNISPCPLAPRPSVPRPSCSQNNHDFVVGQDFHGQ